MGTVNEKFTYLDGTKTAIKNAIIARGVPVATGDTFRSYASKIPLIGAVGSQNATALILPTLVTQSGSYATDGFWTIPTVNSLIDSTSSVYVTTQATAFTWARLLPCSAAAPAIL